MLWKGSDGDDAHHNYKQWVDSVNQDAGGGEWGCGDCTEGGCVCDRQTKDVTIGDGIKCTWTLYLHLVLRKLCGLHKDYHWPKGDIQYRKIDRARILISRWIFENQRQWWTNEDGSGKSF